VTFGEWTALGLFVLLAALCWWAFDKFDEDGPK